MPARPSPTAVSPARSWRKLTGQRPLRRDPRTGDAVVERTPAARARPVSVPTTIGVDPSSSICWRPSDESVSSVPALLDAGAGSPRGAQPDGPAPRGIQAGPSPIGRARAEQRRARSLFALSASATLQAGEPVAEQITTRYNDGSTQTESLLKVPDLANNTVTSYETINLRNNGGTETVVATTSFSGGTTPLSGTNNTHTLTITLPNGSTESETYQVVIAGNRTVVTGTLDEANGGVETWTADKVKHGPTTINNRTVTEPDGTVENQNIVTTKHGQLDATSTSRTRIPSKWAILYGSSATSVIRIQPPSS